MTKDSFQGGSHGRGRNTAGKQELNSSAWKRRQEGTIKCVQLGASLCLVRVTDCMEDPHTDTLQQLSSHCAATQESWIILDQHASVLPCHLNADAAIQSINC